MPFPLRRLPFLAISEVIQSMDIRAILCLSVLSKKSANFVMLSIPKNSLSAEFTFRKNGFLFELIPKGFMKQAANLLPVTRRGTKTKPVFTRFSTCGLHVQCEWTGTSEVTRKLFYRFSKTFKKSKFSITFQNNTRERFALEMMRFAWENGFPLDRIDFCLQYAHPKTIRKLLKGCQEHTSLYIGTKLPEGFKYTPPPGGYKFESLVVRYAHWVNLDDFLQCRTVYFLDFLPDLANEYLNGLLKKIVNMECGLELLNLNLWKKPSDFPAIVRGLSDSCVAMSFPLRRLPFLAINEVIKSMDTRGILFLSVLSKKSANFVMLSIPKKSLSAGFTFWKDGFQLDLKPKGFMKQGANFLPVVPYRTENEVVFIRFSKCGLYIQCYWTGTSKAEESIRKLFYRFSKTFKNSKFSLRFGEETREEFAMEMMRFAWENDFLLDRINFHSPICSSESIQELLNGSNGHYTSLCIRTKLPEDFKCTPPPGGYKFKSFSVRDAHWVNLDDFLQCRKVSFWGGVPDWTVEYLNGLFKKIANLESRIEHFSLSLWNLPQITQVIRGFAQVVRGLSESAIERDDRHYKKLQFKRKDGLKLLISLAHGIRLKMTTF